MADARRRYVLRPGPSLSASNAVITLCKRLHALGRHPEGDVPSSLNVNTLNLILALARLACLQINRLPLMRRNLSILLPSPTLTNPLTPLQSPGQADLTVTASGLPNQPYLLPIRRHTRG